jgi:histone-lysine N-methyltransferase SUV420H
MSYTRPVSESRNNLTHRAFSEFDDIATEMLIDWAPRDLVVCARPYWNPPAQVRKMNLSFYRIHDASLNDIHEIIFLFLSRKYNLDSGLHALLEIPSFRSYVNMLPDLLKSDFFHHIFRYLKVHLPDCPFDISATARYTGFMENTCLIASRKVAKGIEVKYLRGKLVSITPDEEEALAAQHLNFSTFASDLTGLSTLLGPARLLNHDCESNARLVTVPRSKEVLVVTKRDIFPGEEITVDYGDDYFDPGDCLCQTCETRRQKPVEHARSVGNEFRKRRHRDTC